MFSFQLRCSVYQVDSQGNALIPHIKVCYYSDTTPTVAAGILVFAGPGPLPSVQHSPHRRRTRIWS
jgi:hypothetical protein